MSTPKARRFYQQPRWDRVRKEALHIHKFKCARCKTDLRDAGKSANVHHRIPLERAPHRGFDLTNLEPLCLRCHNAEHGRGHGMQSGCDVNGQPLDRAHPWNSAGGRS